MSKALVPRRAQTHAAAIGLALMALPFGAAPASAGPISVDAALGQSVIDSKAGQTIHLRINLKTLAAATGRERGRTPVNVALVLDRSGSMQGARLSAAKEAARLALDRLSADDFVSVIAFHHAVDVLMPSGSLRDQSEVRSRISAMTADGTTAIHAGVSEGGRQVATRLAARRVNRVVLMSDGQANVGPSSPKELGELGRQLASKGITVTTIGLGDAYNEDLMQRLASASDGNHAFAREPADLVKFFDLEFGDAQSVAAQDITIEVEIEAGFRPKRVLSREAEIKGQRVSVKLASMQADNERYIIVELEKPDSLSLGDRPVARATVVYTDLDTGARSETRADVGIKVSASAAEVAASRNTVVESQVATQVAVETTERAVELRDKGDVAAARQMLMGVVGAMATTGAVLSAPGAPAAPSRAIEDVERLRAQSEAAAKSLDDDTKWAAERKGIRHQQNTVGTQKKF